MKVVLGRASLMVLEELDGRIRIFILAMSVRGKPRELESMFARERL